MSVAGIVLMNAIRASICFESSVYWKPGMRVVPVFVKAVNASSPSDCTTSALRKSPMVL